MIALNSRQMSQADSLAISQYRIPSLLLMESAGFLLFKEISARCQLARKILFVCGAGNNAGDGFVSARYMKRAGFDIKVILLFGREKLSEDARVNFEIIESLWPETLYELKDATAISGLLESSEVIVDAVFGTGLDREVTGVVSEFFREIEKTGKFVVSADIPSGICGTSGKVMGSAVKADLTVTFGALKTGLLLYPGYNYAGDIVLADIGLPEEVFQYDVPAAFLCDREDLVKTIPLKKKSDNKKSSGVLVICAGSAEYPGAALICAKAAIEAGASFVYLLVPEELKDLAALTLNEIVVLLYNLHDSAEEIYERYRDIFEKADAFVVGPGCIERDFLAKLWHKFIQLPVPIVADAGAIASSFLMQARKCQLIITPHEGELARLLATSSENIRSDRLLSAAAASQKYSCVTVLKGYNTIIASDDGRNFFNRTGCPAMATAGMGDALAGIIGAFAAGSGAALNAALLGVFIHGLAGDICAAQSAFAAPATDMIKHIKYAGKILCDKNTDFNSIVKIKKIGTADIV